MQLNAQVPVLTLPPKYLYINISVQSTIQINKDTIKMNPQIPHQTPSKQQHAAPVPQPNKSPIPLQELEPETQKTTREAAKLYKRRLEHAVLLSALRSRVPHCSIPGILASVSVSCGGGYEHRVNYDYKHHSTYTNHSHYNYNYSYEPGYGSMYVIPGGIVMGGIGYGQPRVLDDSFLRRAYKRRDLVRKRKASSGGRSAGRGSVGSEVSPTLVLRVDS